MALSRLLKTILICCNAGDIFFSGEGSVAGWFQGKSLFSLSVILNIPYHDV